LSLRPIVRIPRRVIVMQRKLFEQGSMSMRQERTLGVVLLVSGLIIAGAAVTRMGPEHSVQAQATPQTQTQPSATPSQDNKPAESMPGGTRPTTPAPEPATPQNNESGTTGTAPASPRTGDRPPVTGTPLPPAPAEKMAPPVEKK
jgi:hypothetical protein